MRYRLLVPVAVLLASILTSLGPVSSVKAQRVINYNISSSDPSRVLCSASTPVDFTAIPANAELNETARTFTYQVHLNWASCGAGNGGMTRAYAIFSNSEANRICHYSGSYKQNGPAYDCVKYVGSPGNRYDGPNGLICPAGSNATCATGWATAFVGENSPTVWRPNFGAYVVNQTLNIPNLDDANGSFQGANGQICQFYKTRRQPVIRPNDWSNPNHIGPDRCITLNVSVSWSTSPNFTGSASIEGSIGEEFEEGSPATAIASISNSGGSGTASYDRYFWYDANGDGYYRSSDGDASISIPPPRSGTIPINAGATSTLPPIPTTITSNNGAYKQICTSLETSPPGHNSGKCYPIVRRPYFHVYNGDINAVMKPCTGVPSNTSSIRAYNRGAPGYEGSGTSIAAYAVGQIEGFTSAMRGTTKPKYLSFANTGLAPANSQFGGGGANAVTSCVSGSDIPATGHSIDGAEATGSDDVFISSNNSYPAVFGLGNMPNHTVTAKGNIFISSDVTELNGVFKAGRNIYTCATAAGVLPNKSDAGPNGMTQKCSKQLVVNGALIASNVYLMRTTGSLVLPNPAEKIILSPEAWIKSLVDGGTTGKKLNTQYDAILNMPPVL